MHEAILIGHCLLALDISCLPDHGTDTTFGCLQQQQQQQQQPAKRSEPMPRPQQEMVANKLQTISETNSAAMEGQNHLYLQHGLDMNSLNDEAKVTLQCPAVLLARQSPCL